MTSRIRTSPRAISRPVGTGRSQGVATEDGIYRTAAQLKAINPAIKTTFYWHTGQAGIACYNASATFNAHPEWWLRDDNGDVVGHKDSTHPGTPQIVSLDVANRFNAAARSVRLSVYREPPAMPANLILRCWGNQGLDEPGGDGVVDIRAAEGVSQKKREARALDRHWHACTRAYASVPSQYWRAW